MNVLSDDIGLVWGVDGAGRANTPGYVWATASADTDFVPERAELGSITSHWQGIWSNATAYYVSTPCLHQLPQHQL